MTSWQAVAVLVDPVRRALFDCVRRTGRAVSREEAADTVGVSRPLAAFHLDKLVEAGLLAAHYEAPGDRPRGRGRTPKVYQAVADVDLSLPPRRYELLASLLADAIAARPDDAEADALRRARDRGVQYGRSLAPGGTAPGTTAPAGTAPGGTAPAGGAPGTAPGAAGPADLAAALARLGFEPIATADGAILLDNCPFHSIAVEHPHLVCGLNLAFVGGLLDGLGSATERAVLAPRTGHCCVQIAPEP